MFRFTRNTKTETKKDWYSEKLDFHFPNVFQVTRSFTPTNDFVRRSKTPVAGSSRLPHQRRTRFEINRWPRSVEPNVSHTCRISLSVYFDPIWCDTGVEYFNTVTPGNRIEFNRSIERALRAAIYDFTVALHSRFIRLWTAAGTYWDCQPILPVISTPVLTPDVSQTRKPVKLSTVSEEIKTSLQARDESSTKKIGPIVRRQRNVPRRRFHGELCFYI